MINNKGFTLIELLGAMIILSVITTIAIVGMGRYLKQSKERAYEMLSQSVYEAYENCVIQNNCTISNGMIVTFDKIKKLVTDGYLDSLKSPGKKEQNCTDGTINITVSNNSEDSTSEYKNYQYEVNLTCPGVASKSYTWPEYKGTKTR